MSSGVQQPGLADPDAHEIRSERHAAAPLHRVGCSAAETVEAHSAEAVERETPPGPPCRAFSTPIWLRERAVTLPTTLDFVAPMRSSA